MAMLMRQPTLYRGLSSPQTSAKKLFLQATKRLLTYMVAQFTLGQIVQLGIARFVHMWNLQG